MWFCCRRLTVFLGILIAGFLQPPVPAAIAQEDFLQIFLPTSRGATVYSTLVQANANYANAQGQFLESEARARFIHAKSVEQELKNSVDWVRTYFERKEINKAYQRELHTPYADIVDQKYEMTKRRIIEQYHEVLRGDFTDELNWLLDVLATSELILRWTEGNIGHNASTYNVLSEEDAAHIRLTDGGRKGGEKMTFRANDGKVLQIKKWPFALSAPDFRSARLQFDNTRDRFLSAVQNPETNREDVYSTAVKMQQSVDGLTSAFCEKYGTHGDKTNRQRFANYSRYLTGKRFLRSLAIAVARASITNDVRYFDGSNRFDGNSVTELVYFMCQRGLEFAPPEPGDDTTYHKLFHAMRHLYLAYAPDVESSN